MIPHFSLFLFSTNSRQSREESSRPVRTSQLRFINARCGAILAGLLAIGLAGCDKMPWDVEEPKAPAPVPTPVPPKVVQPAPTPPPVKTVEPPKPPPRTADDIIADFNKLPSQNRGDQAILELAALDEAHREQITSIDANAAVGLTEVGLNAMKKFPNLTSLGLNQIPLRGKRPMTNALGDLTHIETLSLHKTAILDEDLHFLSSLVNLKHLILDDTDITDKSFVFLKPLMKLERIDVNGNLQIDGSGFAVFADPKLKHPGIKVIHANKSRFGQKGFEAIYRSRSLEEIEAAQCYLNDAKLQGLSLSPNLRVIRLGHDQISDGGLALINLKAKPKLETFILDNSQGITDGCLKGFIACKKLKTLQLTNTRVTPAGMEKLRKQLKTTNVIGP